MSTYVFYSRVLFTFNVQECLRSLAAILRIHGIRERLEKKFVAFEILTAVDMNTSNFRDITPCSSLKVDRCFGGTCYLRLEGRRISQARNQHEAGSCYLLHAGFILP
jgi:hypothetical protein